MATAEQKKTITKKRLQELRNRLGVVSSDMEQRLHPNTAVEEAVVSNFFGATRLGRDQKPSARQWEQARDLLDHLHLHLSLIHISEPTRPY